MIDSNAKLRSIQMPFCMYLAGIKDVYTCEIVGYAMGERMTKELTGKALFMALRSQRPPAGLIHHSDRGSQYCAYDYRVIQEQFGLKTSMSRKGNCYDNAPMESFWGTLKNESLSHYRFNNRDEAISVIREYIGACLRFCVNAFLRSDRPGGHRTR